MKRTRLTALLLTGALAAMTPLSALAVGTPACTSIANTATVNYNVGTAPQAPVDGVAPSFKVGNKVNLEVVTTDIVTTVEANHGSTNMVLTFTITNTGNKVQDYALSPAHVAGAAFAGTMTDEFDAGAAIARVESGANAGYQAAEDTADFIDGLAPTDPAKVVYVVVAGPVATSTNNNDNSVYRLIATTYTGEGAGLGAAVVEGDANGSCGEATVFADLAASTGPDDADEDGKDSERSGLTVKADATLTVSKASVVYSDPVNGIGAGAKAIPGAVVTYTITITNPLASTATASSVSISDSLDAQITAGNVAFNTLFDDGTACAAGEGIVVDGVCKTNAGPGGDNVDWNVTNTNTITVTGLSLAPNTSKTIKFQVTIQ